jgi:lipopolysaccharide/colanic/teichoic acid biosynthesis glycosyltransferase
VRIAAPAAKVPLVPDGEANTPEKFQHSVENDLSHIESRSLLLDLYILLRTPFALHRTENTL